MLCVTWQAEIQIKKLEKNETEGKKLNDSRFRSYANSLGTKIAYMLVVILAQSRLSINELKFLTFWKLTKTSRINFLLHPVSVFKES